jgi:hypothetical protein
VSPVDGGSEGVGLVVGLVLVVGVGLLVGVELVVGVGLVVGVAVLDGGVPLTPLPEPAGWLAGAVDALPVRPEPVAGLVPARL